MLGDRSLVAHQTSSVFSDERPPWYGASGGKVVSLTPILTLVRELAAVIVPVHLRDEFRDDLGRNLLIAARQQVARDLLTSSPPPAEPLRISRRLAFGAATVGSAVSLASIVALVFFYRRRPAA